MKNFMSREDIEKKIKSEGILTIEYEEVEEGYVHNIPEKDRITTVLEVPKK